MTYNVFGGTLNPTVLCMLYGTPGHISHNYLVGPAFYKAGVD